MEYKKRSATVDQGYSWVVMFSTFTLFCLFSGNFAAHGVFLPEFVDYFRVSKADAAIAGSLTVGLAGMIGIVLGPLIKRFGVRLVVILGGLLGGVGISAASQTGDLGVINIFLGILPGYLVDITGNFATPFLMVGSAQIISGICSCFIYFIQRTHAKNNETMTINVNVSSVKEGTENEV